LQQDAAFYTLGELVEMVMHHVNGLEDDKKSKRLSSRFPPCALWVKERLLANERYEQNEGRTVEVSCSYEGARVEKLALPSYGSV